MSQQQGLLTPRVLQSTSVTTATSEPQNVGRDLNYSIQVTALTTGTSIVTAVVVTQASNDRRAWIPFGSATCLATNAAASGTAVAGAALTAQRQDLGWLRTVMTVTGTGSGMVIFAQ